MVERPIGRWSPTLTVDRAGALARVWAVASRVPERNAADIAGDLRVCPTGLVDDAVWPLLAAEGHASRVGAAPLQGNALAQPAALLAALALISHRRALHERRTIRSMTKEKRERG